MSGSRYSCWLLGLPWTNNSLSLRKVIGRLARKALFSSVIRSAVQ